MLSMGNRSADQSAWLALFMQFCHLVTASVQGQGAAADVAVAVADGRLPEASRTQLSLELADRVPDVAVTAEAVTLTDGAGKAEVDIGLVAYVVFWGKRRSNSKKIRAINGEPAATSWQRKCRALR